MLYGEKNPSEATATRTYEETERLIKELRETKTFRVKRMVISDKWKHICRVLLSEDNGMKTLSLLLQGF